MAAGRVKMIDGALRVTIDRASTFRGIQDMGRVEIGAHRRSEKAGFSSFMGKTSKQGQQTKNGAEHT